jgi:hypothetical protein
MIKTEYANTNTLDTHLCLQFNLLVAIPPFFQTTLYLDKYYICMKFGNNTSHTTELDEIRLDRSQVFITFNYSVLNATFPLCEKAIIFVAPKNTRKFPSRFSFTEITVISCKDDHVHLVCHM